MAKLSLLSLTQLQKLAPSPAQNPQSNPRSVWMWNPKQTQDQEDDSWEVRAFAEDTGNVMGTTWPPRSYTCTFCRREFRSAQALGGHMNVHRRDRARLHQAQHPSSISINPSAISSSSSSIFIIPTQEFLAANGGLCLLYQFSDPNNGAFTTSTVTTPTAPLLNNIVESSSSVPSSLLALNPLHDYLMTSSPSNLVGPHGVSNSRNNNSHCQDAKRSADEDQPLRSGVEDIEDLDLELRLGPS